jgi:hypothetical protein
MPGWGESRGMSDEMVRKANVQRKADQLARAVTVFLDYSTTGNRERMELAVAEYKEAKLNV